MKSDDEAGSKQETNGTIWVQWKQVKNAGPWLIMGHGGTKILTSIDWELLHSIRWHSVAAWVVSSEFSKSGRAEWQGGEGCELSMFFSQAGHCGLRKPKTYMCFPMWFFLK